jgi:hypothetical protein
MENVSALDYSIEADPNVTTPAPPLDGRRGLTSEGGMILKWILAAEQLAQGRSSLKVWP